MEEAINDTVKSWREKIVSAENETSKKAAEWRAYYRLFKSMPPPSTEAEKGLRANTFVPIVQPQVLNFVAKELMYFFGSPNAITIKVEGKRNDKKAQLLEDRMQTVLQSLFSQPHRYTTMRDAIQDKYIYGNAILKVMPAKDKYDIFETYNIAPWDFLHDPNAVKWDDVEWAGHRKVVTPQYLKAQGYDNVEELEEKEDESWSVGQEQQLSRKGIELIEIWDKVNKMVYTIGDRKILLRERKFPYKFPYIMLRAFTETNMIWSMGLTHMIKWTQFYANMKRNLEIDTELRSCYGVLTFQRGSVGLDDIMNIRSNGYLEYTGSEKPDFLNQPNLATRELGASVQMDRAEAELTTGALDWTQGRMLSKRMTTPEVYLMSQEGGGRFWDTMKNSEAHGWLPWVKHAIDFMKGAPRDLFDKLVAPLTGDEEDEIGSLTPADIRKYDIQITATMANNVLKDMDKRAQLAEFLKIVGAVAPAYLKVDKALELLLESYRNLAGIKGLVKTEEEVMADMQKAMEQTQQAGTMSPEQGMAMRGGGGTAEMQAGGRV